MPSALELRIEVREVYGKTLLYPVNDAAMALARIAGTKTLEPRVLKEAKQHLGATVLVNERHVAMVAAMLT